MTANRTKWIFLTALALIWGSSFILIKRGLVGLSPFQLGSLRMVFASSFLLIIGFGSLPKIPSDKWKFIALTAIFGTFVPAFLFSIAQTQISSTISSILNSLTPLNTLIIGIVAFSIDYRRNQVLGVIIGLSGSALLILGGQSGASVQNYWYALLVVVASGCYALNVNLIKKYLSDVNPLTISVGNSAIMLFPALAILFGTGFFGQLHQIEVRESAMYILILGVVGTGIANLLFFKLIQVSSPVFATSVTYLIPVVAFFWGLFDGEKLAPLQLFGAVIVLAGVYLSSRK